MDSGISSAGNKRKESARGGGTAELDLLLAEMLLTVRDMPELGAGENDIPYHAREDSRPFTYGHLSSPGLVRKARPPPPPTSPDFHEGTVVSGSMSHHSSNNLSWLQRQQQKLRERRRESPPPGREGEAHDGGTALLLLSEPWNKNRNRSRSRSRGRRSLPGAAGPGSSPSAAVSGSGPGSGNYTRRAEGYASDSGLLDLEEASGAGVAAPLPAPLHVVTSAPVSPVSGRRRPPGPGPAQRRHQDPCSDQDSGLLSSWSEGGGDRDRDRDPLSSLLASLTAGTPSSSESGEESSLWGGGPHPHPPSPRGRGLPPPPPPPPLLPSTPTDAQFRDGGYSWRTTSASEGTGSPGDSPRPRTPAFPVHPRTPYSNGGGQGSHFDSASLPPKSPSAQRKDRSPPGEESLRERDHSDTSTLRSYDGAERHSPKSSGLIGLDGSLNNGLGGGGGGGGGGSWSPTLRYPRPHSRRSSVHSSSEPPQEVSPAHVEFVRDTSRFWYKPTISREEAISLLRDEPPGTFVVRDSNSFPGAFGLALKVATAPPGARSADPASELVRHFLVEPTSRGVRLKGCPNEPVFSSLSALVYQHSLVALALPSRLTLPRADLPRAVDPASPLTSAQLLLAQGAACNVLYLMTVETESLTGPQAIVRAMTALFSGPLPTPAIVHFKVSGQGITLTDNKRQLFFRRHYPVASISYCGLDPDDHRWSHGPSSPSLRCFGFVARKPASKSDNQCHAFAELEPGQPATAIVNFVSKVMMSNSQSKANIV